MTTQERFARRRKKLEEKLTRLDLQEARTLQREQAHDEQIARDLAGVPGHFAHGLNFYKLFWLFFHNGRTAKKQCRQMPALLWTGWPDYFFRAAGFLG